MSNQTKRILLATILCLTLTAIFLVPFCGFMYKCGCTFLWSGSDAYCNVYQANVPHCPWCTEKSTVLMALPFLGIFVGQGVSISFFGKRYNSSFLQMFLIGMVAAVLLAILNGYIFKISYAYPYFF